MFVFRSSPLIVRRIQTSERQVFLTFDDGPTEDFTPRVLDKLAEAKVVATFFVIGEHARKCPQLIKRIQEEGHGLFSHSMDHGYSQYFAGRAKLQPWLDTSLQDFRQQTGLHHHAFRPPLGLITPPLLRLCEEIKLPLILWNHRFFDTVFPWTASKARKSAHRLHPGDIILLHDRQKPAFQNTFLETLDFYLQAAKVCDLRFSALSMPLIEASTR
jgi:peptidoglycan/xylan/chitin deacetylase (PgdA/CDA1 family)